MAGNIGILLLSPLNFQFWAGYILTEHAEELNNREGHFGEKKSSTHLLLVFNSWASLDSLQYSTYGHVRER